MNHTNNNAFAVAEQLTETQHAYNPIVPICSWSVVLCCPMTPAIAYDPFDYFDAFARLWQSAIVSDSQGCPTSLFAFSVETQYGPLRTWDGAEWQRHDNLWCRQIFDNEKTKPVSYNQPSPFLACLMKGISCSLCNQLAFIALLSDKVIAIKCT
jgi:hypothetical protein